MKKILAIVSTLAMLAFPAMAQHAINDGTSYYLPKTGIRAKILVEKKKFTPGEFSQYATRYMKSSDVVLDASETYRIVDFKMEVIGAPDETKYYQAKISPKMSIEKVYVSDEGLLRSVNVKPDAVPAGAKAFTPAAKPSSLRPRDYMSQEILSAGSNAKMAQLCAEEIYTIRSSRNELTRGTADTMPKDGEQLKLMLASLDTQEKALMQLFEGVTTCDTMETVVTVFPKGEVTDKVLFRFSEAFGLVDADDLSGEPCYVTVKDLHQTPEDTRTEKEKLKQKDETGLFVNIPGKAKITATMNRKQLEELTVPFAQFGRVENMSALLFGKKVKTTYQVNGIAGHLVNLTSVAP